jgi:hypothetical protein
MYKFTALLNTYQQVAYLSGNNNCMPQFTLSEMYTVAKNVEGLSESSPYVNWANSLASISDFEFCMFFGNTSEEVINRAETYARKMGCKHISRGRPSVVKN